jgi:hypothetical protein
MLLANFALNLFCILVCVADFVQLAVSDVGHAEGMSMCGRCDRCKYAVASLKVAHRSDKSHRPHIDVVAQGPVTTK